MCIFTHELRQMSKKSTTEEAPRDKDGGAMRKLFNCEPNPLTVM